MTDISIHNVQKIEIEKYQLNSGVFVCNFNITTKTLISKQESNETITLYSNNKETYEKIKI